MALRHQLAVYKRSVGRPKVTDRARISWLTVMRMLKDWRDALLVLQPATVIRWHRNGYRYHWRRKSRSKPRRPPIPTAVLMLILRLSIENVTWGAPRIKEELARLGHTAAISMVAEYLVRRGVADPKQTRNTFPHKHTA